MVDRGVDAGAAVEEFVEFLETGATASGEFQCAECGYGVSVQSRLPACPMCAGELWEPKPSTTAARAGGVWRV